MRRRAFPGKGNSKHSPQRIPPGLLTMGNQSLTEGDSGSTNMTFTAQLGSVQDRAVSFDYRTEDGTGTAGVDYTAVSGSKTINAGATSTTIDVPILGDTDDESDETFTLRLSNIRFV
jgi:hypothetical protein